MSWSAFNALRSIPIALKDSSMLLFLSDTFHLQMKSDREVYSPLMLFPVLKGNDIKDGDTVVYEGIKVTPDTSIKKAILKSTFEDANNYMKDGVYLRQVIDVIDEIEFEDVKESHAFGFVYEEIL